MTNRDTPATELLSELDKLMDSVFPTSVVFASSKDRPLRWTKKTVSSGDRIYVTIVSDKGDLSDDARPVVTVTTVITVTDPETSIHSSLTTRLSVTNIMNTPEATPRNESTPQSTSSVGGGETEALATTHRRSHDLSEGAIAAIALGTVLSLVATIMAVWICVRKRGKSWKKDQSFVPPNNPILNPQPPTPPPLPELPSFADRTATPDDSWISCHDISDPRETLSQGVRSPTPQPAVAEVMSYTRAWQKPRVYTVGGPGIAELPGSEPTARSIEKNGDISPTSPVYAAYSPYRGSHVVSPLSPTSRFRPQPPWGSGEQDVQRRRY
ncbi:hypothetical protein FDECE_3166 [Fusarium decemcellulare]|nr:hypothetical protein FDECE_3166 [Fusarium decemcellulare]